MAQLDGYYGRNRPHRGQQPVGFDELLGRTEFDLLHGCRQGNPVTRIHIVRTEAVVQVMRIALAYRRQWNQDVYIDLLGYRKYGHNEGDEPMFTQPQLYKAIAKHDNPFKLYTDRLVADGSMKQEEVERVRTDLQSRMEEAFEKAQKREMRASRISWVTSGRHTVRLTRRPWRARPKPP